MLSDDLKSFSFFCKLVPEILHVVFNWIETHHPVFFFYWFALRFREVTYAKKPSVFQAASIGKRETKETFCFGKRSSHYNTLTSHYCFVSASGYVRHWTARNRICFVMAPVRYEVGQFFFRSVSLLPSKTKISILKQIAYRARSGHSFFAQVIVTYKSIECQSKYHSDRRRKRDVMH